jgi:electron transfer flavoprotein-quinone oxidoreductase
MASGQIAGQVVVEAKKKENFSAKFLSLYRKRLEDSFVLKDMDDHKDIEDKVRENRDILTVYPRLACEAAHEYFTVDGMAKRDHQRRIIRKIRRERGIFQMIKDALSLRHAIG